MQGKHKDGSESDSESEHEQQQEIEILLDNDIPDSLYTFSTNPSSWIKHPGKSSYVPRATKLPRGFKSRIAKSFLNAAKSFKSPADLAQTIIPSEDKSIPATITEAKKRKDWKEWKVAIKAELDGFRKRKSGLVMALKENADIKPIPCRFVLDIRKDKRKARCVIKGFMQEYLRDYKETYSPVLKSSTFCFLASYAARDSKRTIRIADVDQAFLNTVLNEEIYMELPEMWTEFYPLPDNLKGKKVCIKLLKALYGLKQASMLWFYDIWNYVQSLGFKYCEDDPCLLHKEFGSDIFLVGIYVDDIIMVGSNKQCDNFIADLRKKYGIKDYGSETKMLGINIEISDAHVKLSQTKYIDSLVSRFHMENANHILSPLESNSALYGPIIEGESPLGDNYPYRELIGCLNYLAVKTRPDIAFATSLLSQSLSAPTMRHWNGAKRVIKYLKTTRTIGLNYARINKSLNLELYADASFNSDGTGRGQNGYMIVWSGGPILWKSQKQTITALSATESETLALCEGVLALQGMQSILEDLRIKSTPKVYDDSQALISQIHKERRHGGSRYSLPKFRFLVDTYKDKFYELYHISGKVQPADMLTKPLGPTVIGALLNQVNLR